ncbi:Growth-regulating factor 3 [Platanthera guangdongensis]|uniref:Growth-regulating factor n=1 Tax=Platanthera guangdongensis TaxID=2320717 RepID=A0ABR2M0K4_9ASPA
MQPFSPSVAAEVGWRQPFTAAQWRELEHQALIFKYLIAGVPVPPDLLIPIQKSFESLSSRFFHHLPSHSSPVGYFSYYGKKLDPEPGRCRRTDGKKWRCAKDAHTDSKYCERHMHRSRNRSRKHVESKTNLCHPESQLHLSSSSTATSQAALSSGGSFQDSTTQFSVVGASKPQGLCSGNSGSSTLQSGSQDYGMGSEGCRHLHGSTNAVDEHNFFSKYPGGIQTGLMQSHVPSFTISKEKSSHPYSHCSTQLHSIQDLNELTIRSVPKHQEQHISFFKSDFSLPVPVKQDFRGLRPAFNEWPKAKELWTGLEDGNSKQSSFSATQLSISIPINSSGFSTTSCCSPNDLETPCAE